MYPCVCSYEKQGKKGKIPNTSLLPLLSDEAEGLITAHNIPHSAVFTFSLLYILSLCLLLTFTFFHEIRKEEEAKRKKIFSGFSSSCLLQTHSQRREEEKHAFKEKQKKAHTYFKASFVLREKDSEELSAQALCQRKSRSAQPAPHFHRNKKSINKISPATVEEASVPSVFT